MRLVIACVCMFLAACGSSGGGDTTTVVTLATAEVHVDKVTLTGSAVWPGAQQVEVSVDGQPAQISGSTWTAAIDMLGQSDRTVEVMLYADGTLVAGQALTVSK